MKLARLVRGAFFQQAKRCRQLLRRTPRSLSAGYVVPLQKETNFARTKRWPLIRGKGSCFSASLCQQNVENVYYSA
jgi:hypothetical protein